MALGNTKMQAILKEYDGIRERNHNILSGRRAEVEAAAPAYFAYHGELISLCMKQANASLYPESASVSPSEYQTKLSRLRAGKKQALLDLSLIHI